MRKLNLKPVLLMLFATSIIYVSCSKDDDTLLNNTANGRTTSVFNSDISYGTMTDKDGNIYKTVTIGNQTWMAENLRATLYNDGSEISNITSDDEWVDLTAGAYCIYNNSSSIDTIATYGCLYNWYAVKTGNLAPEGWHVPTLVEWRTLMNYLGGEDVAGGKLKEIDTTHWNSENTGATNETGFTALPGGYRSVHYGGFYYIGVYGNFWSSTAYNNNCAYYCLLCTYYAEAYLEYDYKQRGFSVRCVKD